MPSPLAVEKMQSGDKEGVRAVLEQLISDVNAKIDPHEALKFAVVVKDPWTIENGLLTPTMKIRRNEIEARYADQVDAWYANGATVIFE